MALYDVEDNDGNRGSRRPWSKQRMVNGRSVMVVILIICIVQSKPTSELGGHRAGQNQQLVQEPIASLRLLDALADLESFGLDFYLQASDSTCPSRECRMCTNKIYKEPHRNIAPARECERYERVKNESCMLCATYPGSVHQCYTFREVLEDDGICVFNKPSCCEKARMADLNNYCIGGSAVCESYYSDFQCMCPRNKKGDKCQEEDDSEKVLCKCYNKKIKLLKDLDCDSVYYSKEMTCTFDSIQGEHCFCTAVENADSVTDMTSCDDYEQNKRTMT